MTTATATQATTARAFDWEMDWDEEAISSHYDAIASRTLAGQTVGLGDAEEVTNEFWAVGEHCPMLPPVQWNDDETEGDDDWDPLDDGDYAYDSWVDDRLTA